MANLSAYVPSFALPHLSSTSFADVWGFVLDPFGFGTNQSNITTLLSTSASQPVRTFVQSAASTAPPSLVENASDAGIFDHIDGILQRLANFDGVFNYVGSRWALSTIVLSLVLNRAHVYASSRERLDLNWRARIFLRIFPLFILCLQIFRILQTLRCQTSSELPEIRFKDTNNVINRSWADNYSSLHTLLSKVLFWQDDRASCSAVRMVPMDDTFPAAWQGSTNILWPLFIALAFSQFIETMSAALQGRQPRPETGMTMFEHSMAFAEAQTVTRTAVGLGLFNLPLHLSSPPNAEPSDPSIGGAAFTFTRGMLLRRLNVPPEVLLVSLISAASHVASHVLAIVGRQSQWRLANTSIWGMLYISLFLYSFRNYSHPLNAEEMQKIRYPTVCIIGYLPHLVILVGMTLCGLIYAVAVICTLFSAPSHWRNMSLWERVKLSAANMSASASLSNIKIKATEDFYTMLLKTGYNVLSAAAEAVYFNEGVRVTMSETTWLDRARTAAHHRSARPRSTAPLELQEGFAGGEGFGLTDEEPQTGADGAPLASGYAIERKTMQKMSKTSVAALREEGVGISQRSGRWFVSWKLVEQTGSLLSYCVSRIALSILDRFGIGYAPRWLLRLARVQPMPQDTSSSTTPHKVLSRVSLVSSPGSVMLPFGEDIDVEAEFRNGMGFSTTTSGPVTGADKQLLDSELYAWFKRGGRWGNTDTSGDFAPPAVYGVDVDEEEDLTSVISEASSVSGWASDSEEDGDGARTPTQRSPRSRQTLSPSPSLSTVADEQAETTSMLARLLDPQTLADKQEAQLLAARLRPSPFDGNGTLRHRGPMTRSQYMRATHALRPGSGHAHGRGGAMSAADEELVLDSLVSLRRPAHTSTTTSANPNPNPNATTGKTAEDWANGAPGMGSSGPQCAICRSAPRTVLVWPCRCLSLCDECRASLATNNFGSCVCCRRDVVAFSRLYVP